MSTQAQITPEEEGTATSAVTSNNARKGSRSIDIMDGVRQSAFTDVLAAADVLLLHESPGVVEMCVPSKLTSYFAAGRPVLAATSPRSAAAYEISASGAGTVVDPSDPAELLGALRSLIGEPSFGAMGHRGQAYARERLSEDTALDAYRGWSTDCSVALGRPSLVWPGNADRRPARRVCRTTCLRAPRRGRPCSAG